MNKKYKLTCVAVTLIFILSLSGCQEAPQDSVSKGRISEVFGSLHQSTQDQVQQGLLEKEKAEAEKAKATSTSKASGKGSSDKSITGIPDVISTLTKDDGSKLVLVNKYYTVSKDYKPIDLVDIDGSLSTNQGLYVKREAYDAYLKMLGDAKAQGLSFAICSAYRSYDLQTKLYNNSLAQSGAAFTNTRSAYPGRSEHHTGWAIDVTSASMGWGLSQKFANYPDGAWINSHCSEYGFIIRYPKGKTHLTGYDYEPWHLRYVGVDVAKDITARGITLEEYLGK